MHQPATEESEEAFDTDNIADILFQSLLSNVHKCETYDLIKDKYDFDGNS